MKIKLFTVAAIVFFIVLFISINWYVNRQDRKYVRVEILNGSGIASAGKKTADYLRERQNDVICISDAPCDTIERTLVVERTKKNRVHAKKIASQLKSKNIFCVIDSSLYVDVTVIVGKDYNKYIKER